MGYGIPFVVGVSSLIWGVVLYAKHTNQFDIPKPTGEAEERVG
jgi:hypothetical protein